MKRSVALLDFAEKLGFSAVYAVGLIDQLRELEKALKRSGKALEDVSVAYISSFLGEPAQRFRGKEVVGAYRAFEEESRREANAEANRRYRGRKKRDVERDAERDAERDIKRDVERDVERDEAISRREKESASPPDPLLPQTPVTPITPTPRERESAAPRRAPFRKPTVDEVRAYCRERGNSVDAQSFADYYESVGWRVGKHPMKDWRAAVRTWERNRRGRETDAPSRREPEIHWLD